MSRSLPESANLEWLKKTAKQKLRILKAEGKDLQLADAQLALAREYGFSSWRALRADVSSDDLNQRTEKTDTVGPCSPFFIVDNLVASIEHYTRKLGFECRFKGPEGDEFFAIVGRGSAQIMIKEIGEGIGPLPNHQRHEWAPMDAYVYTPNPDALADEFTNRNVAFRKPLQDIPDDGLRGFEVADPDGYVCFFGRPN